MIGFIDVPIKQKPNTRLIPLIYFALPSHNGISLVEVNQAISAWSLRGRDGIFHYFFVFKTFGVQNKCMIMHLVV